MAKDRQLIIGIDGFDWPTAQQLIKQKLLPNLTSLINNGCHGALKTTLPQSSAASWATSYSGLWPDQHGILTDAEPNIAGEGQVSVTSESASQPMFWHWLKQAGKNVQMIACPLVTPAASSVDVCISQNFPGQALYGGKWADLTISDFSGITANEVDLVKNLRIEPADIPLAAIAPLITELAAINQDADKRPAVIAEAFARNLSRHNVNTWLLENKPGDITCIYYSLFEQVSRYFMVYQAPKLASVSEYDFHHYQKVIAGTYQFFDALLGGLITLFGNEGNILLLSHFGFSNDDAIRVKTSTNKKHQGQNHNGIGHFIWSGNNILKQAEITAAHQLDIVPTLLTSLGIALPTVLAGRVWHEMFSLPVSNQQQAVTLSPLRDWPAFGSGLTEQDHTWLAELTELGLQDPLAEQLSKQRAVLERTRMYHLQQVKRIRGEHTTAINILAAWVQANPRDLMMKVELISLLFTCGNLTSLAPLAKSTLEQIDNLPRTTTFFVNAVPLDVARYLLKAILAFSEKETQQTRKYLQKIELNLITGVLFKTLFGHCLLQLKEYVMAQQVFEQVLSEEAEYGSAYSGLTQALFEQNKFEQSLEAGFNAVELQPGDIISHRYIGLAFEAINEIELALLHLKTYIQKYPQDASIQQKIASIELSQSPQ
ncbi:alkaline phosphatase family protein [Thalassotalea agariperforans]